jgi:hypothetical protein
MRRFADMNNLAKAATAATGVTVVVALGLTLLWSTASAQPGSSPTATSHALPARHTVTEKGIRFSFRVPAGWERFRVATGKYPRGPISLNKSVVGPQGAEGIIYWTSFPDGDYADPCNGLLGRSVGPSAADLAVAVSKALGTKLVNGPSNVTLGGYPAKHVVLSVRKNVGCDPGFFYSWANYRLGGAFWHMNAGDTIRVWIVPVGGTRLFIGAATNNQANSRLKREIQEIVESIHFVPAGPVTG